MRFGRSTHVLGAGGMLALLGFFCFGCGGGGSGLVFTPAGFAGAWLVAADGGVSPVHRVVFLDGEGGVTGGGPGVVGGSYTLSEDGRFVVRLDLVGGPATLEGELLTATEGTVRFDDGVTAFAGGMRRAEGLTNVWGGGLGGARTDGTTAELTFMSASSGALLWCDGLPLFASAWIVRTETAWAARFRTGSPFPHDEIYVSGSANHPLYRGRVLLGADAGTVAGEATLTVDLDLGEGEVVGTVEGSDIDEASGLVASRRHGNVLWCHNDSGGGNVVYAITTDGARVATFSFDGPTLADTEDVAIGPGPIEGVDYLYLGDVGDNGSTRAGIRIVRFPEPDLATGPYPLVGVVTGSEALEYTYPVGTDAPSHKDCEAVMIDPLTGDLILATKRAAPNRVYRARAPLVAGPTVLERVADLPASWDDSGATGGDISPDGRFFLLRRYAYETPNAGIWARGVDRPLEAALTRPAMEPRLAFDGQGEAVCWHGAMEGLYTTQEGVERPLRFYSRRRP